MRYEEICALTKDNPCKDKIVGALSICDINNFIQDKNIDSIYISKKLFKNISYITNKEIIKNKFNDILYYVSTSNLGTNKLLIFLKKMLGGFDFNTSKFYCMNGKEIEVSIIEDDSYCSEMFLMKDNKIVGYIDTCCGAYL